MKIRLHL